MRENDLGSIQPGKLADLVVMDRDYLTIPADQIKAIKSWAHDRAISASK